MPEDKLVPAEDMSSVFSISVANDNDDDNRSLRGPSINKSVSRGGAIGNHRSHYYFHHHSFSLFSSILGKRVSTAGQPLAAPRDDNYDDLFEPDIDSDDDLWSDDDDEAGDFDEDDIGETHESFQEVAESKRKEKRERIAQIAKVVVIIIIIIFDNNFYNNVIIIIII